MTSRRRELDLVDDERCFVCGPKNPLGLRLKFTLDANEELVSEFKAEEHFQGFQGILHGGVLTLLLDEMMVNIAWLKGYRAVSTDLQFRLKKAVRLGERIRLTSRITLEDKRLIKTEAHAFNETGALVAEAQAVCLRMKRPRSLDPVWES